MWPVLVSLRELGGSGTVQEINDKLAETGGFSSEELSHLHGKGPMTEIEYRSGWARWRLKTYGAIANSERGVWVLTDVGRALHREDMPKVIAYVRENVRKGRRTSSRLSQSAADEEDEATGGIEGESWRDQLLETLLAITPESFEHLAARLLREKGFTSVNVLGRTGDGGLDGVGVLRISLINFKVFFQCKRYKGSVGPSVVRDFRGAMAGRSDRGLLITTGVFSRDAKLEATREGAPAVDLIDGEQLCDFLLELGLGVQTRKEVVIDPAFFTGLGPAARA